ncbi:3,4-dihydroxy-2-butanone-4-phosphate synthase [Granulicella sibirica]|uniref:3,4-dihydroxy-2-butanone 4-phosphate synthase n=1 Tax=Granulicella sibirica TaxID=2479048 RepID=A0A4V1L567_9BACT|nr:3,4-dihydroxy-2-butanone 4-phosphate synthase [Granulicella sibirica]
MRPKGRVALKQSPFTDVPGALAEMRARRMVVVIDNEDRENEGDVVLAADCVTPEAINFMAKYARGLICLSLTEACADHLRLPLMSLYNTARLGTAFTESIDAIDGVGSGISAYDRAATIRRAVCCDARASDFARPGHVFPLRGRQGGVLTRTGHTEASIDLARLAGWTPAAVICEIMNDDGTMARLPHLINFCCTHNMKLITIAELVAYRLQSAEEPTSNDVRAFKA